ncbi:uncharacterized protein LOC114874237 isoform X1 [Osmia bicornis bicornis]|uniref:uncharacterized protein LOC114874237 isoform X1 n=1 Tax=Osmia bicornis bicornis TaxID=1437191 RepID=UPI001EAF74D8|nr:uncharacterized protein LOC114874237 isoform X1 [Osmia bicornis bicornis]
MLVCGVFRTVLSVSFGAIVQILIFLQENSNILRVQASLPPGAEDEIILIEHLPGRRVHLQDFFWTDAKDAPPWVDPNQGLTFYETRTIHHTVTLYSPVEDKDNHEPISPHRTDSYDPKCTSCIEPTPTFDEDEDQNIGVLIGEDPGPRYWLLTVLRAGETVPPKIELRLARLYRTAFSRQQQRHLGLLQTDPRLRRVARDQTLVERKPDVAHSQKEMIEKSKLTARTDSEFQISKFRNTLLPKPDISNIENHKDHTSVDEYLKTSSLIQEEVLNENVSTTTPVDFNESTTEYIDVSSNSSSLSPFSLSNRSKQQILNNISTEQTNVNKRSEFRLLDHPGDQTVQVRMQNTSVTESGATKLIYSVHLGGKPVPAETAARDMALLSPQEVALELGAPVIIQSEPYLKETQPLALSRRRDAWLLIGAASAGFILLALIVAGLIFAAKRKRAHSAVAAPPTHHLLKKKRDYIQATADLDNAFSTSEVEAKTDGTSHRQTPGSLSRTPVSLESPDSLDASIHEVSSDNDEEQKRKAREPSPWEHPPKRSRLAHGRMSETNVMDTSRTSDSTDVIADHLETFDSLENNYSRQDEEATASPHSYLSMPSCKQFPSMKSVEPLSRVLEPVMVKHLDIDSPELARRDNDYANVFRGDEPIDRIFARTSSAIRDPGVVGPIVWNLRRQHMSTEGNGTSGTDVDPTYVAPSGPVGRARRRLHELLEDSFSLFGSRDPKNEQSTRPTSAIHAPDVLTIFSETKGRSIYISPTTTPVTEIKPRPRTSLPGKSVEESVNEHCKPPQSRSGWGSRPLSAGPFHRPNLPDIDTRRILTDCQLSPEDPAVPLIASIKKELDKFSPR